MLTSADWQKVDRSVDFLRRATWTGWGRVPHMAPGVSLLPEHLPPVTLSALHDDVTRESVQRAVRAARVYVAQQNAIDAPFQQIAKEKATGAIAPYGHTPRARSARGVALGLVSNATKDRTALEDHEKRPVREKLKVNKAAARIKRMRTAVGHAARLLHFDAHCERDAGLWNKKFITLTYRDAKAWRAGHFGAFRKALNHWCVANKVKLRFVWVAELQRRGAVHYHVVVWLPKGKYLPFADAQGWWPHGATNIRTAQSPISYIAKYASKTDASAVYGYPKGARMHGAGGLDVEHRRHLRYWQAPFWVRDALSGRADIRKVTGGYMDKFTGEFLASPWRVYVGPGGEVWAYRIDQQEAMQ